MQPLKQVLTVIVLHCEVADVPDEPESGEIPTPWLLLRRPSYLRLKKPHASNCGCTGI
jgi:hypothetical protein